MTGLYVLGVILCVGLAQGSTIYGDLNPKYVNEMARGSSSRVVGGQEAAIGQFPHQLSLRMVARNGDVFACGGSVIHSEWIITAAHCTANRLTFVIRFGVANLTRPALLMEEEDSNSYLHPFYNTWSSSVQRDDIALVKLSKSITFGPLIQPIRLQNSQQRDVDYSGVTLTVSGFGRTDDTWNGGTASEVLMWTLLRGISNAECRRFFPFSIHPQTICAQYYDNPSQSACQGDSGGPLTRVDEDGELTMVGIVSFGSGQGCNNPIPSAYVRPGYYIDWIEETTGLVFDWTLEPPAPEASEVEPEPALAY